MNKLFNYSFGVISSLCLIFSLNIISQEVEEVVVTATKKEESIQDIAVSIEAFTSEALEENLIRDASDLQEVVPGLIADKGIGSGVTYAIRGTGSYGVGAAVVGAVVVSTNGHDTGGSRFYDLGLFDVDRVEVLKGPQGTLFGRNAIAGVINTITKRPTSEYEGSFDVDFGNYGSQNTNLMLNFPMSDSVSARLALSTVDRDGFNTNIRTGEKYNDKHAYGARLSVDWDISDDTVLKLTYSTYDANDNRNNVGTPFCDTHGLYGCNPLTVGSANQPADSRGSTAALFNVVAALNNTAYGNSYANSPVPQDFNKAYLTRVPEHESSTRFAQAELVHQLNDDLTMTLKVTHSDDFYYHMNDNDYSHSDEPFPGFVPAFGPISFMGTFGGTINDRNYGFTEIVSSDRTYEFSHQINNTLQAEINIISDFDGPFNYTVGYYSYDDRSHNRYQVQTAAWNLSGDFSKHPYNALIGGGMFGAYGGIDFMKTFVLGGIAGSTVCAGLPPISATFQAAAASPNTLNPACLGVLLGGAGISPFHVPTNLAGYINDDHIRTKSKAFYGEMYYDLSEATKLTVGLRYNDDVVMDNIMTCLTDFDCPNYPDEQWATNVYGFHPVSELVEDDATAYKLAVQHNLSDDQMVYASYTTAVKAGGNNPVIGTTADPYDQEETGVLELGMKSILFDGAMLFNAALFMNDTKGMLISNLEDAGAKNYNVDAEIMGFEGNILAFLNETTSVDVSWLIVESELGDASMPDPINPLNIVTLLNVNPAACSPTTGLCAPVPVGTAGSVESYPADPLGAVIYGYGIDAAGNTRLILKSAGYLCSSLPFNPLGEVSCSDPTNPLDISGNTLPQSPKTSYSIGLNKDFMMDSGALSMRVAYRFQGEREGRVFNDPRSRPGESKLWDLNMTYRPNDGDWFVRVYGKNLADKQYIGTWAASSALQGGAQFATYTDPRTFGVQFGTNF